MVGAQLIEEMGDEDICLEDVAPWIQDMKQLFRAGVKFDPTFVGHVAKLERHGGDEDPDTDVGEFRW